MSAAAFVLAINLLVAAIFATSFGVVAAYQRSALGARWLAFAYGLGVCNIALEFILPYQADHRPVSFAIFTVFLLALAGCVVGMAHHYRIAPPWRLLALAIAASLTLNLLILELPRGDLPRNLLYQAPYAAMQAIGVLVALKNPRKRALDLALLGLWALSGLHFLGKPFLAVWIGSGAAPQDYIGTTYAAFSQSVGAVLVVAIGLLMLLIILRDVMAEMTDRSETDALSSLLNRRGFESRGNEALCLIERSGVPGAMIVADLDYFKQINDGYGHAAGDGVIAAFARCLRDNCDQRAVVGRLGGEEFAAFIPGANLAAGKLYAEAVRSTFRDQPAHPAGPALPVTASFGVAQSRPGETLSELLRRADAALYEAKTKGRDRVCLAFSGTVHPLAAPEPGGVVKLS